MKIHYDSIIFALLLRSGIRRGGERQRAGRLRQRERPFIRTRRESASEIANIRFGTGTLPGKFGIIRLRSGFYDE
jgi:hypothetical protein